MSEDGKHGQGTLSWVEGRTPPPVMSLGAWLPRARVAPRSAARGGREGPAAVARPSPHAVIRDLVAAAGAALDATLERPGRVRESAFNLLAADALLTYACEAVVGSPDAEERLEWILASILDR